VRFVQGGLPARDFPVTIWWVPGVRERNLIEGLPKMRRAGRTDVSDLKVSINALTPVSEPLYAVA
jgi:hypothetical protein